MLKHDSIKHSTTACIANLALDKSGNWLAVQVILDILLMVSLKAHD